MSKTIIRWLGTGGGLHPDLGDTSFLVFGQAERVLLVDCGTTVPIKLVQENLMDAVTDVIITHPHADHIGGLERFAFHNHFVSGNLGARRPHMHVATENFAHTLWENSLKAGMENYINPEGQAITSTLDTFFNVHIGKTVAIEGLPTIEFIETPHVPNMENYALRFSNGVYYSGDTTELPPHDPILIFQDCKFGATVQGDTHISYERLNAELPDHVKAKIHLVHVTEGEVVYSPKKDGFAGVAMPDQEFEV